jgi:uncharacterized protein involved in exopolysaccharide biosynthesis
MIESTKNPQPRAPWLRNAELMWSYRVLLARTALCSFVASLALAFLIHNRYTSTTRIMPPDQPATGAALLATLAGKAPAGLPGGLAGSLLGMHNTGELFIDLIHSDTVAGKLIDRFDLEKLYHTRFRVSAAKTLAARTTITDDKKSGVITIAVTDTDPQRAQQMAQSYLDELNGIVERVNTSSARREREFIATRLSDVRAELNRAETALSDFSSKNTAVDIKEQTRALVDAGANVQAGLIAEQTELESLEQIYGDENFRVKAAKARISILQGELKKISGTSEADPPQPDASGDELYPPLRQLPHLDVEWANLYRSVRVQETVFELLSAQYEAARIEEAKELPVVSVIDPPSWPEKRSIPPRRLLLAVGGSVFGVACAALFVLLRRSWNEMSSDDPRRGFVLEIVGTLSRRVSRLRPRKTYEVAS